MANHPVEQFTQASWLNNGVKEINFEKPTEIQHQNISRILKRKNITGQSPTNTGQSHEFLLPLIRCCFFMGISNSIDLIY